MEVTTIDQNNISIDDSIVLYIFEKFTLSYRCKSLSELLRIGRWIEAQTDRRAERRKTEQKDKQTDRRMDRRTDI